jgi:hypothetical protein
MRQTSNPPRRKAQAWGTALVLAVTTIAMVASPAAAATDAVTVDFATSTGDVLGAAAGALYGLSDAGVPTTAVVAGARPLSITTKPPGGAQHPNGDPLDVAPEFFAAGGKSILVNIQDIYPDWPYTGGVRPADFTTYLTKVTAAVSQIKAADPTHFSQYVFVPFNEPDVANWYSNYSTMKTQFLADWSAAYTTIKAVDATAKIGGPGLAGYNRTRLSDLLAYAKARNQLPDVVTWHELATSSLANYRGNYANYRALETSLGVSPIAINITEWGNRSDLAVPGQLVQWLAMMEDTKVAGNTAYWTYAGNLNDNTAGTNQANGGWWSLKWYGDLTGKTVALTPPKPNTAQTVQGIAALDSTRHQGTVLVGGAGNDLAITLKGLDPATFGTSVDVRVRRAAYSGYDGDAPLPPVILGTRLAVSNGTASLSIPNSDRMSAYQVIITPAGGDLPAADAPWLSETEAEKTTLANVTAYSQDTDANAWLYATSGKSDVGSTNQVGSSLTWSVTVPATGTYRLSSYGGANKAPGQHALFVDGEFNQLIQYTADLGWTYRGKAEVTLPLTAGKHTLSVRMSRNGTTLLPGGDIALDKFDLTRVPDVETATYPARFARVIGTTSLVTGAGSTGALLSVGPAATGQFFLSARENGYHDLAITFRTPNKGTTPLTVTLNGRPISGLQADAKGTWTASARVHLAQGISELRVSSTRTANLDVVQLTRATDGDSATQTIEAESGTFAGAARRVAVAATTGTNVSGGAVAGWVGSGAANTVTIARPVGLASGAYDVGVRYANADQNSASHYNTDVISRSLTVSETGGGSVTGAFRHNYSWNSFWWHTLPLVLTTTSGDLVLGNTSGPAPDLDQVSISPLVLSTRVAATSFTAVTSIDAETPYGQGAKLKVSVTDDVSGSVPTGTVRVLEDGTEVASGQLSSRKATITLPSSLTIGLHSLIVRYQGDDGYAPSSTVAAVTVVPSPSTTKVWVTPHNAAVGDSGTASVTVTADTGVPVTGKVTISVTGGGPDRTYTATLAADGQATVTLKEFTTAGAATFTATYAGSDTVGTSQGTATVAVT